MQHAPTTLERIIYANEGLTPPADIFASLNAATERDRHVDLLETEKMITRRVQAMLKYVFGVCQKEPEKKPTAEKATKKIELIVARNVSEIADPQLLIEETALDDMYQPDVAEALISMEEALHEKRDEAKPASGKSTLRELMAHRSELVRKAA